jgi:4-carboxymuconolactone decarboxylase
VAPPPAAAAPALPDDRAPAGAPYTAVDVTIPTPRGYTLAGTLTRPAGAPARVPVVVTISGSGQQERDERLPMLPAYAFFREVADTLGRRGVAVLRYDDRGTGASGGRETLARATSADFADDARAVVAWLRTRPDVDQGRILLAGHSEGGLIAPLLAAADTALRGVALLAGPAYSGRRILLYQNDQAIAAAPGLSPTQRDSIRARVPADLDSAASTNPWIRYFLAHDPLPVARQLRQPVLILQGDTDRQVTPDQADTLAAALTAAGNRDVTLRRFPDTNHLFLADPSGDPQRYAALPDSRIRREVLGADYVDNAIRSADDFNRPLQELVTRYCWGEIWNRPTLDRKTRSIINLAMLTALNRPHEVKLHIRGAINNGLTKDEIGEVLLQAMIYCGVPAAIDSFRIAREVFTEMGI